MSVLYVWCVLSFVWVQLIALGYRTCVDTVEMPWTADVHACCMLYMCWELWLKAVHCCVVHRSPCMHCDHPFAQAHPSIGLVWQHWTEHIICSFLDAHTSGGGTGVSSQAKVESTSKRESNCVEILFGSNVTFTCNNYVKLSLQDLWPLQGWLLIGPNVHVEFLSPKTEESYHWSLIMDENSETTSWAELWIGRGCHSTCFRVSMENDTPGPYLLLVQVHTQQWLS